MTQPNAHARRIARRAAEREQARQAAPTYIPNNVLRQSDARAIIEAERNRREQAGT